MPSSHRPGSLRQDNKKHKGSGSHQSKRATKSALGAGRVESARATPNTDAKRAAEARKQNRTNHAIQMRKKKREEVWLQNRVGSDDGPPRVCVWVSLSASANSAVIQHNLLKSSARHTEASGLGGMVTASFNMFKQRMTFLTPERDVTSVLELAKVADLLLVVLPVADGADDAVDQEGEVMITALKAAGLAAVVGIVQGLEKLKGKKQTDGRKWGQRFFETEFAGQAKVVDASNTSLVGRTIATTPARRLHWRSIRSYLVSDTAEMIPSRSSDGSEQHGALHIRGYIRGRPLDVNQVVHISDAGHFRMRQINSAAEPCPLKQKHHAGTDSAQSSMLVNGGEVLAIASPDEQEDLNAEARVDNLAGEQTWPTENELAEARLEHEEVGGETYEGQGKCGSKERDEKSIPHGWSGYQAEWLVEGDIEKEEDAERSDEENTWALDGDGKGDSEDGFGDLADATHDVAERRNAEEEDSRFPDEVDTPANRSARERFARFRALKSFRTSPWDPKESLPADYSRIFQFEDFSALQKDTVSTGLAMERQQNRQLISAKAGSAGRVSRHSSFASTVARSSDVDMAEECGDIQQDVEMHRAACEQSTCESYVASGLYVEVVIDNVPLDLLDTRRELFGGDRPLLLFSLLRHEHRLSVLNFNIHRDARFDEPVPSKEPLIFHCGFRRWTGRPIFSQANLNSDKHKYERFLRSDCFTAASVYGPTTFQPSPVLVFKEVAVTGSYSKRTVLIATGTLLGVDPDRIVLKKVVLTGYPIRVRKRRAVLKHMFHSAEDVKWFKPAELVTKYGLTGHIKEPVGTHGLMKVIFNKSVKQNDTVCLNLYKRVYPKMVGDQVVIR